MESEGSPMALAQEKTYTIDDIYALPDGQRAELIDGRIYMMAPPNTMHQNLVSEFTITIGNYIRSKGGNCKVFPSPFAVFLNKDDMNYVEPDISVICDKSKLDKRGCNGAPDWIIEIISPSTERIDCGIKLFKYRSAGVREYWMVNPKLHTVTVYDFEHNEKTKQYSFDDNIPSCIFQDFSIHITNLLK